MRVQIVDPPAYTPPFDRSLCEALARAGVEVELVTAPFPHGEVAEPRGYRVREDFYRRAGATRSAPMLRRVIRAAEHLPGMIRHRLSAVAADVVHYQWLTLPLLDSALLPSSAPLVLTAHGVLRSIDERGAAGVGVRRMLARMDAVIALSEYGAKRLREEAGVAAERVHVIPHGALDYLTRLGTDAPLPAELEGAEGPVILCFGLIRPYKGVDLLLEAFAGIEDAELWIVGRPFGVDMGELHTAAARAKSRVRFVPRYVSDAELATILRRAEIVALPYRDVEQSGVLYAALAFGRAIVASDVGGFTEVAARGAAQLVPPGDKRALAEALTELIADPASRERLAEGARAAAAGPYSWDAIAASTIELYRRLIG